jgi:hypothetical protein
MIISKDLFFLFPMFRGIVSAPVEDYEVNNDGDVEAPPQTAGSDKRNTLFDHEKLWVARQPFRAATSRLRLARARSGPRNGRVVVTHTGRCRED